MRGRPNGFTIVGLLAVLLVLSLVAATTVRIYFSKSEVTLENAAVLLARDVRAAQHRSIFLGEKSLMTFLTDGSGYVVTDTLGVVAHNPQTEESFRRIYPEDGVFLGVRVLEVRAGTDRTFEIDGRGVPLEDLEVTLGYRDDRRTVVVTAKSGAITIDGSSSGWIDSEG